MSGVRPTATARDEILQLVIACRPLQPPRVGIRPTRQADEDAVGRSERPLDGVAGGSLEGFPRRQREADEQGLILSLEHAWKYFDRPALHKLSAVDVLSFVLMAERRIRVAFAFDGHFAAAGFRMIG